MTNLQAQRCSIGYRGDYFGMKMRQHRTRIVFFHHGGAEGGAALSLKYLVAALDQDRYEIVVVNAGDEQSSKVNSMFEALGVDTVNCLLPRFAHTTLGSFDLRRASGWYGMMRWAVNRVIAGRRLAECVAALRPDIVHLNSLTLAPYAAVPHAAGVRVIVHVREPVLAGLLGIRRRFLRHHLIKHVDKVIAICRDNLDRLDLPPEKATVVFNPVDFSTFDHRISSTDSRTQLGIAPRAKVALFAGGSVASVKGLREFLQAMAIVRRALPSLVCLMPSFNMPPNPAHRRWSFRRRIGWMLGMFRQSDALYELVTKHALQECIVRCDFVENIAPWIAASDVVCVPHVRPHFSRTIMEAGAMKKPVAAFSIGGVEEVVKHEVTGLLVPRGSVDALAEAVLRLMVDTPLASKLGEGGYHQAVSHFSASDHVAHVTAVYEALLASQC